MMHRTRDVPKVAKDRNGGTFSSFQFRNFRLFFVGQGISQIGNWLTLVAQSLLVLDITHGNAIALGFLVAIQFSPVLFIGAWAGLVADRADKRKLLLIVQSLAMVQSFGLAALAFMHHAPLFGIYAVAFFGGFTTAFDNPTRRAYVVEMVPSENVQNAVSLNSALMTSSRIIGPTLAGVLITTVGYGWCFAVDGISYIAVLIGLWMMRPSENRPTEPTPRAKGQVRAGFAYTRSQPELWVPLVMMAVVGALAFNFPVVLPLFATKTLGGTKTTFTLIYSVISVGALAGALATARRKTVEVRDVVRGTAVFGVAMTLLALAPNLAFAFPLALVMGFASILFMTTATAIMQVRSDPAMRGRVLALQAIVFLGSTPIGGPILGLICKEWGARAGFLVGGAACGGAAIWGYLADRPEPVSAERQPIGVGGG